jgi:hypothetical protein
LLLIDTGADVTLLPRDAVNASSGTALTDWGAIRDRPAVGDRSGLQGGTIYLSDWTIQDPTGGFLISAFGALLLLVTLHVHNTMGALWRFMARHLLAARATAAGS